MMAACASYLFWPPFKQSAVLLTTLSHKHIVQPSLFERVNEYADNIADDGVDPDDVLSETSPIIVFCENFFLQLFENLTGRKVVLSKPEIAKELSVKARLGRKAGQRVH